MKVGNWYRVVGNRFHLQDSRLALKMGLDMVTEIGRMTIGGISGMENFIPGVNTPTLRVILVELFWMTPAEADKKIHRMLMQRKRRRRER